MDKIIFKILKQAVYAPSGDNSQPWEFYIKDNTVYVFNIPKQDNQILNFKQRGSYIAHGALVENIIIASTQYGLLAEPQLMPEKNNPNLTAKIIFSSKAGLKPDPLSAFIEKRFTNRKKYRPLPLTDQQKTQLLEAQKEFLQEKVIFITEEKRKKEVCRAASSMEKIMLQYKPLHKAFFELVNWDQSKEKTIGMQIKTLELLPPQKIVFKLFSFWKIAKIFKMLGMPGFIANENAKSYAASSAVGAILVQNKNPDDFMTAGRLLQRIWLKATQMGLSMQPITGILYLYQRLNEEKSTTMPVSLQKIVRDSVEKIYDAFNQPEQFISIIFRIGYGDPPSGQSPKLPPKIIFKLP